MDKLTRDDMAPKNAHWQFDELPSDVQKVLKRAASRGAANSTPELFATVGRDWIMVPSKKGLRQVVVTAARCYVI